MSQQSNFNSNNGYPPPPSQVQQQFGGHQQQQQQQMPQMMKNEPEVQVIKLQKSHNSGMGLSIVAAKGVGKDRLGIYIKAVVDDGAAFHDGRLQAGDQLLKVDGHSLVGITQERAAEIMVKTGQVVELEVGKQGAIYHGLATLLSQPSPLMQRASAAPTPQMGGPAAGQQMMPPPPPMTHSKSVPALYGDQHTYQNQNMPPQKQQQQQPPQPPHFQGPGGPMVGRSTSSYQLRSQSVTNLMPPPPGAMRNLATPTYANGRPASAIELPI